MELAESASVCSAYVRCDHLPSPAPAPPAADNSDSCAQAQAAAMQIAATRRRRKHGGCAGLRRRCYAVLKQQRTRLYILRRCVTMLLCWHEHDLSD